MPSPTLADLRRYAVARSLFAPTTLPRAVAALGFLQADPIRAPARAQDLTLRHRVKDYRAGDLERRYPRLSLDEDFFVNYGFVAPELRALMHPRSALRSWPASRQAQARDILQFIASRGPCHPREVDAHFAHGHATNGFGGRSKASTELLDAMHYRGLLRVARRDNGIRLYAAQSQPTAAPSVQPTQALDRLVDLLLQTYAPVPQPGLRRLVAMLKHATPQWQDQLRAALQRAMARLPQAQVDGVRWYWPAGEAPCSARWKTPACVRLLAPFDPVVWDRDRFERLWGWAYRFEAYTPAAKRLRGYYALPLLWQDQVIGWGNVSVAKDRLQAQIGFCQNLPPEDAAFSPALGQELAAMERFLGLPD